MILLEKRAHLVLETTLLVVRLLPVDVTHQRADISRTDGKQGIPALPREIPNPLLFHPQRRSRLHLRHNLCRRFCRPQPNRKMNVVRNSTHAETLAIQFAGCTREIRVKTGKNAVVDQRRTIFRAEDDMHQVEAQRLRHRTNYMSGLQPYTVLVDTCLGLRPRLVCRQAFGLQIRRITPACSDHKITPPYPSRQITPACSSRHITPACPSRHVMPACPSRHIMPACPSRHIMPIHQALKARQHTSLGRRPRLGTGQNVGGLKARPIMRHIVSIGVNKQARLHPCRTTHQKQMGL